MVSVIMLLVEILLDVVGLVTGCIVLIRSSDNKFQRAWGMLTVTLSLLLLGDNIEWMYIFTRDVGTIPEFAELPMQHLSIWHIFRVIIFFQAFSLFPIASLRPGLLTSSKIITLSIPAILISCIACCYELFNGYYTNLESFEDIQNNIAILDVKVRLVLFIASVIFPSINFLFPFLKKWIPFRRKQTRAMSIYIACYALIMSGYIWLMLGTCNVSFNLFGCIVVIPAIYLNILYLCDENPLSLPPSPMNEMKSEEIEAIKEIEVSPVVLELDLKLESFMKENTPFIDPQYSLDNLLEDLATNENRLNKTLRYKGFSGFRDYINFCRLQYFKQQAQLDLERVLSVKELMFKSGFTSRSSFYRYFANIEKMSPSEYIEMLKNKSQPL